MRTRNRLVKRWCATCCKIELTWAMSLTAKPNTTARWGRGNDPAATAKSGLKATMKVLSQSNCLKLARKCGRVLRERSRPSQSCGPMFCTTGCTVRTAFRTCLQDWWTRTTARCDPTGTTAGNMVTIAVCVRSAGTGRVRSTASRRNWSMSRSSMC